jgi:hypothetical protein
MTRAFLPSANRSRWAVHGNEILQNAAILNYGHRGSEYFVSARGLYSSVCAAGGQHSCGQNILCQRGVCVVQCVLQAVSTDDTTQKYSLLSASKFTRGSDSCT